MKHFKVTMLNAEIAHRIQGDLYNCTFYVVLTMTNENRILIEIF